ncbi:MAG: UDP-glucose 4-epimerase GalE [Alphaproteobacteria bacterium]|nr:UDP-glucose 4-epimerase GalE [Alphaproteobacteria bacterium]
MTVLITGGAGYIGSHMVLNLCDKGENVVVLDNLSTGHDWSVDARARLVIGDAGDIETVTALIRREQIDSIIHFAGSIIVPESVVEPLKYYANNTGVSRNLLEAAVNGGVSNFIFSSTAAVYGMTGLEPVAEDSALSPMSPYGRSKMMTEMMIVDAAAAHGFKYGILRYFNVAGADPLARSGQSSSVATHLIKVALQAATGQREGMQIFGTDYETPDGTCIRDYIHVSDLADAHALVLGHLKSGGDSAVFNCGYGHGFSVSEVVSRVKSITGVDFPVSLAARRDGDPPAIIANSARIKTALGWTPAHDDLTQIVTDAFAWEKKLMTRNRKE